MRIYRFQSFHKTLFNLFPVEISESLSLCVSISKVITCNWWSFFFFLFYPVGANTHSLTLMSPWTNGNEGTRKKCGNNERPKLRNAYNIFYRNRLLNQTVMLAGASKQEATQRMILFILIFAIYRGGRKKSLYKWAMEVTCKDENCSRYHKRITVDRNFSRKKKEPWILVGLQQAKCADSWKTHKRKLPLKTTNRFYKQTKLVNYNSSKLHCNSGFQPIEDNVYN